MSPRHRATMVLDDCGFYRVDTTRVAPRGREDSDTLVFPSQVDQCMIIPIASLRSWSMIIPVFPRSRQISFTSLDDDGDDGHEAD